MDGCLKCVRTRLAAGICPDPLANYKRSPRPPSCNEGTTSKGKGREGSGGMGRERRKGNGGEGGKWRGRRRREKGEWEGIGKGREKEGKKEFAPVRKKN